MRIANTSSPVPLAIVALLSILVGGLAAQAGDWPGWRGPTGVGLSDEADLPLTWGGKKNENVLWKVKLEGHGYSSPVVARDHVYITTTLRQTDDEVKKKAPPEHRVACYQVSDGKQLWIAKVPAGPFRVDNYSVPTPATDGERVFVWFGSAVLAALDAEGKLLWRREWQGPFHLNPSMSSSPIVYRDTVILQCEHNGDKDSFVASFDKATGEPRWEIKRPRAGTANATPFVISVKGRPELIVSSPKNIQGIDLDKGEVLWTCATNGFVPSAAFGGGLVYSDNGVEGPGLAIDAAGEGDVTKTAVKWRIDKTKWSYASPIIVGDYVYRATKPGVLTCWKLSTGEQVFSERLENISQIASPFATPDGRVYFACAGRSYVIKAGPKLEVLAKNDLPGGDNGSSPAVSGGRIFLKSSSELFCIGKK